ncbi:hypothetical protein AVEN_115399-1 [Araneus ventricosus]|uniref:Mos1 transposase HTH domain-containing protein n=1 Tax=Araneus ventricosus TaxID=182803 RepID=A0A4Y1ZZJ7_ARAVE|nr:hypothetical protein AVEN_115399-1 [Araneus ventricosus]
MRSWRYVQVIRFLQAEGVNQSELHRRLQEVYRRFQEVYGPNVLAEKVSVGCHKFKDGRKNRKVDQERKRDRHTRMITAQNSSVRLSK